MGHLWARHPQICAGWPQTPPQPKTRAEQLAGRPLMARWPLSPLTAWWPPAPGVDSSGSPRPLGASAEPVLTFCGRHLARLHAPRSGWRAAGLGVSARHCRGAWKRRGAAGVPAPTRTGLSANASPSPSLWGHASGHGGPWGAPDLRGGARAPHAREEHVPRAAALGSAGPARPDPSAGLSPAEPLWARPSIPTLTRPATPRAAGG